MKQGLLLIGAVFSFATGLPALAAEREAQWRRVREADFLTQNEKRALLGLPPIVEGTGGQA